MRFWIDCREDAEFESRAAAEQVGAPASVAAFKAHPLYVLRRHVSKFQALEPGTAPVGTHKWALLQSNPPIPYAEKYVAMCGDLQI